MTSVDRPCDPANARLQCGPELNDHAVGNDGCWAIPAYLDRLARETATEWPCCSHTATAEGSWLIADASRMLTLRPTRRSVGPCPIDRTPDCARLRRRGTRGELDRDSSREETSNMMFGSQWRACAGFALVVALIAACSGTPWQTNTKSNSTPIADVELPTSSWPTNGGDAFNRRYSPLDDINRDNVANLKAVWRARGAGGPGAA